VVITSAQEAEDPGLNPAGAQFFFRENLAILLCLIDFICVPSLCNLLHTRNKLKDPPPHKKYKYEHAKETNNGREQILNIYLCN
jgi:hypothetical protein